MSLNSALSSAGSGLAAASRSTDLISSNIANAQTEGYVRREIQVAEQVTGGIGTGVSIVGVKRAVNASLNETVRRSEGTYYDLKERADAMENVARVIGDPEAEYAVHNKIQKFMETLGNFADSPESTALQFNALSDAKNLAAGVRDISDEIQLMRLNADQRIEQEVNTVNSALLKIQETSEEIRIRSTSGQDVSALLDQRDQMIETVAQRIPVRVIDRPFGDVVLTTREGVTLYDIKAKTLSFDASTTMTAETIYAPEGETVSSPYVATLSGLKVGDRDISPFSESGQSIDGGMIGGLFKLRDGTFTRMQQQTDALASNLVKIFRETDPTVGAGQDGIFTLAQDAGATLDTVAEQVGASRKFQINAAIDPDQGGDVTRIRDGVYAAAQGEAGDDTNLRAFIDGMRERRDFPASIGLTTSQSVLEGAREFVSLNQLEHTTIQEDLKAEKTKLDSVMDARDNAQGVNIDDETRKLMLLERLYAANATVLRAASEMLDTLLRATGG